VTAHEAFRIVLEPGDHTVRNRSAPGRGAWQTRAALCCVLRFR